MSEIDEPESSSKGNVSDSNDEVRSQSIARDCLVLSKSGAFMNMFLSINALLVERM